MQYTYSVDVSIPTKIRVKANPMEGPPSLFSGLNATIMSASTVRLRRLTGTSLDVQSSQTHMVNGGVVNVGNGTLLKARFAVNMSVVENVYGRHGSVVNAREVAIPYVGVLN